MIDIKRFNRVRARGLSSIVKTEDGFELHFKRFDPENGDELAPEIQKIIVDDLFRKRDEFQLEVDGINAILAEIGY